MLIKMIYDENNPVSKRYTDLSRRSFTELVEKNLLEFELYQCYTPENPNPKTNWNPEKGRTPTEIALFDTYYDLISQRAAGEEFIFAEHDAWLVQHPLRTDKIYGLLERIQEFKVWNPGVATEFFYISQKVAQKMLDFMEQDSKGFKGPMALLTMSSKYVEQEKDVLWPAGPPESGMTAIGEECWRCDKQLFKEHPFFQIVTQVIDREIGITINDRPKSKGDGRHEKHNTNRHYIDGGRG